MKNYVVDIKDLEKLSPIFRGKRGSWFAKKAIRLFAMDKVNALYKRSCNLRGADFAASLLNDLGVEYQIGNAERLKKLPEGAFITVSNHPYGGLDGIMLIDLMVHIRPDYKLMVNSILSLVDAMRECFVSVHPITKSSNNANSNINGIRSTLKHLNDNHPMGFFPSGAVSDFKIKGMHLRDRDYQDSIIRIIQGANVPIVPIRFFDGNSYFFYSLGLISWRLRSIRIPYEIFNKRGKTPRIGIGEIISVDEQIKNSDPKLFGQLLRNSIYDMPLPQKFTKKSFLNFYLHNH